MLYVIIAALVSQPASAPLLYSVPQAEQTACEKQFYADIGNCPTHYAAASIVRLDYKAVSAKRLTVTLPKGGVVEYVNPPLLVSFEPHNTRLKWFGKKGGGEMVLDFGHYEDGTLVVTSGYITHEGRRYAVGTVGGRSAHATGIMDLLNP